MSQDLRDTEYTAEEMSWYYHLLHDLTLLEKAARHLRGLGWWGFFIIGFPLFSIVLVIAFMKPVSQAVVVFLFSLVVLTVLVGPYFLLARYIERGRSWAVVGALFLIGFVVFIVCFIILREALILKQPLMVVIDTFWLIGHLNRIKLLCRCYGASYRLGRRMLPVVDALPADD